MKGHVCPFKKKKKELHDLIRQAHPDRNNGVDKGTEKLKNELDEIKEINDKFGAKSAAGYSGRLSYDIQCDVLKTKWREHTKYVASEAEKQFTTKTRELKRKETMEKKKEMTNLEKCLYLYNHSGSQVTEFKVSVYLAIKEDNVQNDIT